MAPTWQIGHSGQDALLQLSGDWLTSKTGMRSESELRQIVADLGDCARLRFDTSRLGRWDSALVAFVPALEAEAVRGARPIEVDEAGLPETLRRLLALARADHAPPPAVAVPRRVSVFERSGLRALAFWAALVSSSELVGAMVLNVKPALTGELRARASDVLVLMQECGSGALGIVAVVNALIGAILAFVGSVQLRRFGAGIYAADLVGIAVVREMAAMMTAIVMAGRTGGAYAAQIATMQGNEEIDALSAFGIPVYQSLVFPRVAALVGMMPLLYFYGCVMGLAGGMVVSVAMLDMSPTAFLGELRPAVGASQFYLGVTKSIAFGAFIALSSCRIGLAAGRSAADVGRAATGAVVAGIIGVIALDAVFAACAEVVGIEGAGIVVASDTECLKCERLTLAFGSKVVQRDVTFAVRRGSIFAVMGGSGSGKSTVLRAMIGLLPPASGTVFVDGEDFWAASAERRTAIGRRFGILFQSGALWSSMTVGDNVALPLQMLTALPPAAILALVRLKLALVGMAAAESKMPSELSGGMRKRAGLARALALDPEILFFDEPSAGLDPVTSRRLDELILELRDGLGATVVLVSHELPSLFGICDDGVFLDADAKTVIAHGAPRELRDSCPNPVVQAFMHRALPDSPGSAGEHA